MENGTECKEGLAGVSNKRVQSGDLSPPSKRLKLQLPLPYHHPKQIEEEKHLYKLFKEVLDFLKEEHSINDETLRSAIDNLISSFRYDLGHQFSDIDLKKPENRCGYLLRYAIHGAGLIRYKTLQAFNHCPNLRRDLRQTKLRVVSLGGGPGNDVVGFLSALQELGPSGCSINITVVDAVREWSMCVRLVKHFARVGDLGSVSKLFRNNTVDIKFKQAILPGNPMENETDCYTAVENADVILIAKVISILTWDEKRDLIENLFVMMKQSCVILLVDSPFDRDLWKDFEVMYISKEDQTYQLHPLEQDFNPHYEGLFPVNSKSRIAVLCKKNKTVWRENDIRL